MLLDNSGPKLEQFDSTELLSVSIPYDLNNQRHRDIRAICGRSIDARTGWPSLLKQFLINLWSERHRLKPIDSRVLLEILDDMIVSSFNGFAEPVKMVEKKSYFQRAREIIELDLANQDLSPVYLADHLGISKSYLHSVFRRKGISVNKFIIEQRLEKSYDDLNNPHFSELSVTDIAFNSGFRDLSHFSRRFKSRYGVSPRRCRIII